MERFAIKSEEGDVLLVEYAQSAEQNEENMMVEDSEGLFSKPHLQKQLDASINESRYCSSNNSVNNFTQDEREKAVWLDKHCKLLIALYKEEYPKLGKTFELKTKQKLWQHIADKMREHGSYFTASQVQGKWKTFERSFHKNSAIDKPCPYRKELEPFFLRQASKKMGLHLRNKDKVGEPDVETIVPDLSTAQILSPKMHTRSEISFSDNDSLSDSSIEEPHMDLKRGSTVLEELQQWREEFIKERKSKRKYRQAKLRAYKRRTAVLKMQNKLKQRLIETLIASQITK